MNTKLKGRRDHITPAWKARVRSLVAADLTTKAVAIELGMSPVNASRWAHALGFRRMYVTKEERAEVMALRSRAKS